MKNKISFLLLLFINSIDVAGAQRETATCFDSTYIKEVIQNWDKEGRPSSFKQGWHFHGLPKPIDFEKLTIKYQSRYHLDGNEYCRYSWELYGNRGLIAILRQ